MQLPEEAGLWVPGVRTIFPVTYSHDACAHYDNTKTTSTVATVYSEVWEGRLRGRKDNTEEVAAGSPEDPQAAPRCNPQAQFKRLSVAHSRLRLA